MAKVYRFLDYRKALWFADGGVLEDLLLEALNILPNSRDRVVDRSDGSSDMGARLRPYPGEGVALHCTRYVDGQPAGVVPMIPQENTRVAERAPGNQENYLHRDFIAFIHGDHVVSLNAASNAASLRNYLHGLFKNAGLHENASKFDLVRRASADQVARIEAAGGVDRIQMDLSIEDATARVIQERGERPRHWAARTFLDPVTQMIQDLSRADNKASDLSRSRKGNLRLMINVPKGDLHAAKSGIDGVAEILVEDEDADNYVIHLRDGDKITPSEMAVRRRIRIERYANTVNTDEVISEMRDYMRDLRVSGQLET